MNEPSKTPVKNIVTCFPVEERHIARLAEAAQSDFNVIHAGQERIAATLPEASLDMQRFRCRGMTLWRPAV